MGKKFIHVNNTKDGLCPPPYPNAKKNISKAYFSFFFLLPARVYVYYIFEYVLIKTYTQYNGQTIRAPRKVQLMQLMDLRDIISLSFYTYKYIFTYMSQRDYRSSFQLSSLFLHSLNALRRLIVLTKNLKNICGSFGQFVVLRPKAIHMCIN